VVLVRTRNPLNLGAAARAMSNFGFLQLRVVQPYQAAFREARSAVGAAALLAEAEEFDTVAGAVADCTLVVGTSAIGTREVHHPVRTLPAGARLIRQRLGSGRAAILFGSEKVGLSNQDMSHCDWLMRIPTRAEHGSMNLGQAVAVCLYEVARARAPSISFKQDRRPAAAGELERITEVLVETLTASGYFKPRSGIATRDKDKVRRLVRRLGLPADDAEVWLGMLRQIGWKLRSGNAPR
jgi:tRNA/rRNA methyltransferase